MLGKRLGVDLGAQSVRVVARGEGQVLVEPTLVARDHRRDTAIAGLAAAEVDAHPDVEVVRPLQAATVVDVEALFVLLQRVVNRVAGWQRIFRPDLVMAIAPPMSGTDRLAVLDICARLGTRTTYLIDSPIAAALGAGFPLTGTGAHLVADIGAGTVDVACVAAEGTIAARSLTSGGDVLREAVARRLEQVHGAMSRRDTEDVIASLACAGPHEERRMTVTVAGADGADAEASLSSKEIADLVDDHVRRIGAAIREVIDETPAPLRAQVSEAGVTLCGGGARLEGLDRRAGALAGCPARVAADPQSCVIRGAQQAVENLDVLKRSFVYIR
jgi:rod shape-determining protein MreB